MLSGVCQSEPAGLPTSGLHAHYTVDGWQASTGVWQDQSGNGRHSIQSSGVVSSASLTSAGYRTTFLQGGLDGYITFPVGSVPTDFTVCSISWNTSSDPLKRKRVLNAQSFYWIHGHHEGKVGAAWYGDTFGWVSDRTIIPASEAGNWLVFCGQNKPVDNVIVANGIDVTLANGGTGNVQLSVNSGFNDGTEKREWAVKDIVIWSRHLTRSEIYGAASFLRNQVEVHVVCGRLPHMYSQACSCIQGHFHTLML